MSEHDKHFEKLNEAIKDPEKFKSFAKNPAGFAKEFGVKIDHDLSSTLSSKLAGHASMQSFASQGGGDFTAAAVAMGAVTVGDTKIAAVGI